MGGSLDRESRLIARLESGRPLTEAQASWLRERLEYAVEWHERMKRLEEEGLMRKGTCESQQARSRKLLAMLGGR